MKQASDLVTLAVALLDLALITAAFYLSVWLRFDGLAKLNQFIWLYYLSAPFILILLLRYGAMSGYRYRSLRQIVFATAKPFVIVGVISSAVLYLSKTGDYSRLVFGLYFSLAAFLVISAKVLLKKSFERHLRRGWMNVRVALIGYGERFDEILQTLRDHPQWGVAPVAVLDPREEDVDTILSRARSAVIDEVYVSCPRETPCHRETDEIVRRFAGMGFPVRVALDFDELQDYISQHPCNMAGKQGVIISPHNLDPDQMIIKRMMDIAGGLVGMLVLAAMFPFIALAIKLDSPGPVLYAQWRAGKGGRPFRMYKFRSMHEGAETRQEELLRHNLHSGPLFKMKDDPRVTRVGAILRKYSLDEFPQFWNVLRGDMSLVGVRPPTLEEVAEYKDHHFVRISFRPGLTGLWQISGRNTLSDFESVVELDVEYIRNWGFWLDMKIIFRTIAVIFYPLPSRGM